MRTVNDQATGHALHYLLLTNGEKGVDQTDRSKDAIVPYEYGYALTLPECE